MDLIYSFIIPAYNEGERLTTSLPKILDYIRQRRFKRNHRSERRLQRRY